MKALKNRINQEPHFELADAFNMIGSREDAEQEQDVGEDYHVEREPENVVFH